MALQLNLHAQAFLPQLLTLSDLLLPRNLKTKNPLEEAMLQYFKTRGTPSDKSDHFFSNLSRTVAKLPAFMQAELKYELYQLVHRYELKFLASEH